jgi:hypothetical protein
VIPEDLDDCGRPAAGNRLQGIGALPLRDLIGKVIPGSMGLSASEGAFGSFAMMLRSRFRETKRCDLSAFTAISLDVPFKAGLVQDETQKDL